MAAQSALDTYIYTSCYIAAFHSWLRPAQRNTHNTYSSKRIGILKSAPTIIKYLSAVYEKGLDLYLSDHRDSMQGKQQLEVEVEVRVPPQFKCPISLEVMKDPVTLCTGITYDRRSIETWLEVGNNVCPATNQRLHGQDLIPNHTLRRLIQQWCVANGCNGIQRIPTPTVPLNPTQVTHILNDIAQGDAQALEKLGCLCRESERNRKCIASAPNTAAVVAKALIHHHSLPVCQHALAVLAAVVPISDGEARGLLASYDGLRCITRILGSGTLEGRSNGVSIINELAADRQYRERVGAADGLAEALVQLVKDSICPAGVSAIYGIAGDGKARLKMVEGGAIPVVLEILAGAEREVCERCMAALDVLCTSTEGRSAAYAHALAVPLVVDKILRVSRLTDELAVSILWRMCHNSSSDSVLLEALEVGAFHKLLVLFQIPCTEKTRERATGLLKLFNNCASGKWDECTHGLDFKQLQRSF